MEEINGFAADCVVLSCCCNCLALKIIVFIFHGLPKKVVRNTRKRYAKWMIQRERKRMGLDCECGQSVGAMESIEGSLSIEVEGFGCMEEVEQVLEEFSERGEFLFGSFWGRERVEGSSSCVNKIDVRFVKHEMIEQVFNSFDYSFAFLSTN
ncbi:PREDICTED: uncharacterized protein LOC104805235 [Tarenaya hassleriana]|uniref:uncharacterized protein LOC104805235 n=1 Tax=Tarenaya hassleriana TaxID=28532 RepID=UPI00053C6831|nr:PREDICTED: uncharacterized protein LOC104805235 [Tarenaya hassleriana]